MTAGEQGHLNSLTPNPTSLGSWGGHWGQRMGRVWEQPWLESEVRLGPRRARPRSGSGAFSLQVSQPQCGQRGCAPSHAHASVPESVQTPSCGGKGPGKPPVSSSAPAWKETEAGVGGERAGRGMGEGNLSRQAGGPVSGWGQVSQWSPGSGWDKARLTGSAHPGLGPGHTYAGPAGRQPQDLRRHHHPEAG